MAGQSPPARVLPAVRTAGAPAAVAGALAGVKGGGGRGPGAAVSHVSEGAAEIMGAYATITGGAAPKATPEPIPAAENAEAVVTSPPVTANVELQEGTTVKLGDLDQFLKIQDSGNAEGVADQEFNPGQYLRENTSQVRLSSPAMAAKALGKLSKLRAPEDHPR